MDKEKLSQLHHLKKEIELLQNQIDNMDYNVVSDSVKGSSTSFPYVQHSIIITGIDTKDYERKMDRLKRRLARRLDEYMDTVTEINEYIASIEDSLVRQIITLKCVNGLGWKQVAAHIGGGNTVDSIKKIYYRFLAKE